MPFKNLQHLLVQCQEGVLAEEDFLDILKYEQIGLLTNELIEDISGKSDCGCLKFEQRIVSARLVKFVVRYFDDRIYSRSCLCADFKQVT